MTPHPHRRLLAGTLAALAMVAFAACGNDDDDAAAAPVATAPATTATAASPETTTAHSAHTGDDAPVIAVNAVDYAFEDLPATITAGTALGLTNSSTKELHEIVAFRIPDTETRSVDELMALPRPSSRRRSSPARRRS